MNFYKALLPLILIVSPQLLIANQYLIADAYIDVLGGKRISPAVIEIDQGRILSVNKFTAPSLPADAEITQLDGMTILPGLMDMHTHLTGSAKLHGYKGLGISVPRSALLGAKNARTTLMTGITMVRNLGAPGYSDVALRDAINDGDVIGPRMYVSGPALGITGGHCDNNLLPSEFEYQSDGVADGPWAIRAKVREVIKFGADVIKFCATGGVLSKGDKVGEQQFTFEEMSAIVDEAHRRGLIVAAHAHGTEGIKTAIRAGVDSIEHASFLDKEAINMAKKNGTYFSMDIYDTEYILSEGLESGMLPESIEKERNTGSRQRASFTAAVKAGVKMVFGTDAAVYPHGDNPKQLSRMVQFGMTPLQALQAATINAAILLGEQDNLGSLEPGKYADIIGVRGNPLDNISLLESVQFVMKDGNIYKE
jgi:imidazolonepropionase-like amidohydrolase